MPQQLHDTRLVFPAIIASLAFAAACGSDTVQFRDRELFNPPPDQASGFLGYFDVAEHQTTCGNCHVGIQGDWENTQHAKAFNTLASLDSAPEFCFGCHTVNERGNAVTGAAGWNVVNDSVYHDVQCESCHGPGLDHVQNPDALQPKASIAVSLSPQDATNGCAECHQGNHHPFAEEWSRSGHATPVSTVINLAANVDPNRYEPCLSCHTAQGVLKAWGIGADYDEANAPTADHLGITCAVCHDPHGSANDAQLRFPIDVPSAEENLCMKCHQRRASPELDAEILRGPHSPEGPLLLGEGAGWFPPGFQPELDRILGSHGTLGNKRTCASCHVSSFTVTDQQTGDFVFNATGHLFLAIPCVDAEGKPTTDQNCQVTERQFTGCTTSGCHTDVTAARSAFLTAKQRIDALVGTVDSLLALPGPAAQLDRTDGVFTVADGAWFNARLGELPGTSTHNPFLAEQLLIATVNAVTSEYNLSPPPPSFMVRQFK